MTPPTYPARPINGGCLRRARPKRNPEAWAYEPKLNGWRVLVHAPTGQMWNRHGETSTLTDRFEPVLKRLSGILPEWLDCEALDRRLNLGRGSLIVFDFVSPLNYSERKQVLQSALRDVGREWEYAAPPMQDTIYWLGGVPSSEAGDQYARLQEINLTLGAELYEGLVAKRDEKYHVQLRSSSEETTSWVKHRWQY